MATNRMGKFGVVQSAVGKPNEQSRANGGGGTVDGLPFADRGGKARVTDGSTAKGFDPLVDPKGHPLPGGDANYVDTRLPQRQPTGKPPPASSDASAQSRRQVATTPQARLGGQKNLPVDGSPADSLPMNLTPQYRRDTACGSVGNERRPFKLGK